MLMALCLSFEEATDLFQALLEIPDVDKRFPNSVGKLGALPGYPGFVDRSRMEMKISVKHYEDLCKRAWRAGA